MRFREAVHHSLTMKSSFRVVVVLFLLYTSAQASPWNRNRGKGPGRTFSDLLRLPSDHNPWHKAAAAAASLAEADGMSENDLLEKRARSFADLLYFPQGHNPWKNAISKQQ